MNAGEITSKRNIKQRIQDLFIQFFSLFIKKEKTLPEANKKLTEELQKINEEYLELTKDNSFEKLKETYDLYKVGVNPDGGLIAIEKNTGYIKEEPDFVKRVRFASLWRKSAYGNLDIKDEEKCVEECFSLNSQNIYEKLKSLTQVQLKSTGNIDTKTVLDNMKDGEEKWIRVTSRRLFKTPAYSETVSDYFRSITQNAKQQTKPTLSLTQALYDVDIEII